jgi:hypothetical protein
MPAVPDDQQIGMRGVDQIQDPSWDVAGGGSGRQYGGVHAVVLQPSSGAVK